MTTDKIKALAITAAGDTYSPDALDAALAEGIIPEGAELAVAGTADGATQLVRYGAGEMVCYQIEPDGTETVTRRTPAAEGDNRDYALALFAGRSAQRGIHTV